MLEEALMKDIQSINDIKDMATVKLCFPEEQKVNQLQTILPEGHSEVSIRPDVSSKLRSESTNLQNNLSKSLSSIEEYARVINEVIFKVANQINKSGQVIAKAKSLNGVIKNNLANIANIANIKSSEESWRSIIKQDKTLPEKVIKVLSDLQILEISKDGNEIKIYYDKLGEFKEKDFDREEYKKKVKKSIRLLFQS